MRFHSHCKSSGQVANQANQRSMRQRVRVSTKRIDLHRVARRLILEGLEERRLMAFNLFASYASPVVPQELASAQVNNDGLYDLVTLGANAIAVQLGNGTGAFGAPITSPTTAGAHAMAVGDFNSDGVMDVVTANAQDVSLMLGNGDGTFAASQSIALPAQVENANILEQLPRSVVAGDLNGDGKLDLAVSAQTRLLTGSGYYGNYYEFKGYVNVLIGNGAGGMTTTATQALGQDWQPESVAIADLNSDGKNDVLTTNKSELSALLGNGSGGLGAAIRSGAGAAGLSASLVVGDLDQDGKPDTVLRTTDGGLRIQKGDGAGRFTPSTDFGNLGNAVHLSVVTGDVNADGKMDLASAVSFVTFRSYGYYGGYDPFVTRLTTVILGQGAGTYSAPHSATLSIDDGVYYSNIRGVQLADFNRDGRVDLAIIDQSANVTSVAINDGQWVGVPGISAFDANTIEDSGSTSAALVTVSLSSVSNVEVRIDYRTLDGSAKAGTDYVATNGSLVFAPGVMTRTISVPIMSDPIDEYDESFTVQLTNVTGAQISDASSVVTILDNDLAPTLTIADVSKLEGSDLSTTPFVFTLNLSAPSGKDLLLDYALADGTARSLDNDFYFTPYGEIYIPAGTTATTITAYVVADGNVEPNETFYVNLSNPTNVSIADSQAIGTIINDDSATTLPSLTIDDAAIEEGNSGTRILMFAVNLSIAYSQEVRVNYQTSNGTATTGNNDYVSASGTLRFAPNVRTQYITVTIKGDKKKESDERFSVLLSGVVRGSIADGQALGTIINDDGVTGKLSAAKAQSVDAAIAELSFQNLDHQDLSTSRLKKRR